MKLDAPPMKAMTHIQNTAPGPPTAIAVPTPAMLPTPTRDAAEIVKAWNADTDCGSPVAVRGVLSVSVRNISGMRRNCTTPDRIVKYSPRRTTTGSTTQVHRLSPHVSSHSFTSSMEVSMAKEHLRRREWMRTVGGQASPRQGRARAASRRQPMGPRAAADGEIIGECSQTQGCR